MNSESLKNKLEDIAALFGYHEKIAVKPVEQGLINKTFLIEPVHQKPFLLQQINTSVFRQPHDVQHNYQMIYEHSQRKDFFIPAPIKSLSGDLLVETEGGTLCRAF